MERTVVLVLGVDRSGVLADTNMVAALDPDTNRIRIVAIPRDTLVEIPGHGWDKLTHAYSFGREKLSMATVSRLLDIPIDHYVVVNFEGFERVVDAVGGIEIEVTKPMHYDDPYDNLHIHFEPGVYHMNGEKALAYARYRSDSDIHRLKRQQEVIRKVAEKAIQPSVIWKLPSLVSALYATVKTDLTLKQCLDLIPAARQVLAQGDLEMTVLQAGWDAYLGRSGETPNGLYYLVPDLVAYRTEAYRTLYGTEPPADYLARARAAQSALEAAVARMQAADAEWWERNRPREQEPGDPGNGGAGEKPGKEEVAPPGGQDEPEEAGGDPDPGAGGEATEPREPSGGAGGGDPWTAVLVDASGRDLLARYRADLKAIGVQVVGEGRTEATLSRSLLIDHSGDPRLGQLLRKRFPWAEYQAVPGVDGPAVEIYLGTDAP
nr:MAG: hypothetical protein DIU70_00550 [Bacillota bacterium]